MQRIVYACVILSLHSGKIIAYLAADWRGKQLLTNYNAFWFPQVVIEDFSLDSLLFHS